MRITTNRGKTFDINWMWSTNGSGNRLMIELKDDRSMSEIAADFDGIQTFEKTGENKNVKEIYTGYTNLVCISTDNYDGVTRLTLEKGDEA